MYSGKSYDNNHQFRLHKCVWKWSQGLSSTLPHYPLQLRITPPPPLKYQEPRLLKYIRHTSHPPSGSAWADLMCLWHGKSIYRLRAVPQNGYASKEIKWRERKKKRSPSRPFRSLQSCWAKGNDVHRCQGRARFGGLNDVSFLRDNSVFKALRFMF